MKEPNYKGFWNALPHISMLRARPDLQEAFRREYREEMIATLSMLHRVGVVWGATSLHPAPPEECEFCGTSLDDCQFFVDGDSVCGLWTNMCPRCFYEEGHSIGWGKGQLYLNLGDGRWRLVAGGDPSAIEDGDAS
jgi:hypothetical protein